MIKIVFFLISSFFAVQGPVVFAGLKIDKTEERYTEFMPADNFELSPWLQSLFQEKDKGLVYERAKIDFLLEAISESSFEYDRNGISYNAEQTVNHLRKKYRKKMREIKTAEDFIRKIATRSEVTGRRYLAIPGNGYAYYSSDLLYYRLVQLEKFLDENATQ